MSRVADIYTLPPAWGPQVPNTTIESIDWNTVLPDLEFDLNFPRPIVAGGTGANTAQNARTNLQAERASAQVTDYNSHVFEGGSFWSNTGANGAPNATDLFFGSSIVGTDPASTTAIEARSMADPSKLYYRRRWGGTWGAWQDAGAPGEFVKKTGDTMTGLLVEQGAPAAAGQQELLRFFRPINGGVSFPQAAHFSLGTRGIQPGLAPGTRLDLLLKSTGTDNANCDVFAMSWQDNGNVGIGTTTPGHRLHVAGGGARIEGQLHLKNEYARVEHYDAANTLLWVAGTNNDQHYSISRNSGSGNVVIPSGNVGIGVSPTGAAKLEVSGNIRASANYNIFGSPGMSAAGPTRGSTNILFYDFGESNWAGMGADGSGNVCITTGSGVTQATRILIHSQNGNVGIGTTAPAEKLQVSGQIAVNNGAGAPAAIKLISARDYQIFSHTDSKLHFWDNAAAAFRMTIDSAGNVGIGTNSPTAKLQVRVENDVNFWVTSGGGNTRFVSVNDAAGAYKPLQIDVSYTAHNGNFGINTVPSSQFQVQTGVNQNINVRSTGAMPELLWATNGLGAYNIGVINANPLLLNVNSGGAIGIGTSNPAYPLTVSSNNQNNIWSQVTTATAGTGQCLVLQSSNAAPVFYVIFLNGSGGNNGQITWNGGMVYGGTSDERFKPNRERIDLNAARNVIDALEIYDFDKDGNEVRGVGVLAQQAYSVNPRFAHEGQDGVWMSDRSAPMGFVIANLQQLNARLDALEGRL